jgi:pimeloyl-ACP methyl ester carboxylesterase/DNA-binding CsgD family transcriptional regulator
MAQAGCVATGALSAPAHGSASHRCDGRGPGLAGQLPRPESFTLCGMSVRPRTCYARTGEAHVAYQVTGEGPIDLVVTPGFISHLDLQWESVGYRRFVRQLAAFARVIRYDKRGTGLSDPVAAVPTLEQRVDDLGAVLDAAGSARAVVFGYSEGGPTAIGFAARMPGRTLGLILYGSTSMPPPPEIARRFRDAVGRWGQGVTLEMLAPSLLPSSTQRETAAALERASASPAMAAALVEALNRTDVRSLLPQVAVPTLVIHRHGELIMVEQGRYLAEHIAGAEYVELDGADHLPWVGDTDAVLAPVERFVRRFGGQRRLPPARARPRSARAATGWGSLTEAECSVAVLVAEGLSNPAIASRLFVSRHTVESHLKHAYAKLGVSSRVELAALALQEDGKNP